jgi:WD40 repeat protein
MFKEVFGCCSKSVLLCAAVLFPVSGFSQDIQSAPHAALQTEDGRAITALAFSADGKLLAGDTRASVFCWNLDGQRLLGRFSVQSSVLFMAFLAGDRSVVVVDAAGTVTVLDLLQALQGGTGTTFRTGAKPLRVALDAGKQYLAVATKAGYIEIFDLKAMMPFGKVDARDRSKELFFLGFDRLGQQLLAIDREAKVTSWNPATLKLIREINLSGGELHGSQSVIHSAATNRAANVFVVGLEEVALPQGGLRISSSPMDLVRSNCAIAFDWNTGMEVKRVKTQASLDQMAMGPGNDHVATIAEDGKTITMIDLRKGELGSTLTMEEKPKALAISEDNQWLAAGTKSGRISTWKLGFKEQASAARPGLPSLSGRIRTTSGTEPVLPAAKPVKIAILSFEAKGVPQDMADICLNSLSTSLANHSYITLVERKQIQTLLTEQKFQASALTDESTSVQIGKLLNADQVLLCSIGKLGSTIVLTARMLNVETGKVLQGREVICEECRDQDIFDAVKMLASTLAQ